MAKRIGDNHAWIRSFEVTEPSRHCKGFTVYKVTSTVFPKSFPESSTRITVWKRYSDFRKLHKELEIIFKQLYLKGEFPVFPKAKLFGRFEHEVVEERRLAALILLEFTANYTQLFTSKIFLQFFENGYSSMDFLGQIFFSKESVNIDEPPSTVIEEKSGISTPCLEPEIVWNSRPSNEDCESLSPSSISSSLSPDNPEADIISSDKKSKTSIIHNNKDVTLKADETTSLSPMASTAYMSNNSQPVTCSTISKSNESSIYISSKFKQQASLTCKETITIPRANGIVRSATVTDDLSTYFDDEFEDSAFLFPTGSCSSLDTLPGFTLPSEVESNESKHSASSSRGLFSLPRRKPNGFGFFDFLPLFPKKLRNKVQDKEKSADQQQQSKKNSLSVGYICEAAGHFAVAQFHESNTDYEDAFAAYKEGIRVLLAGAQSDTDNDRKLLARNKLEKYLGRAEIIKESYLTEENSFNTNRALSPVFSSPNRKEKCLSSLNPSYKKLSKRESLPSNVEQLKLFKVVGLGPTRSKILVVMNPEELSPKCYAVKVLWKSPCIIYPEKPTIIPARVPFMVKLMKWFDSPEKIILLLQHAGGGRLIDFVTNYQYKRISFVTPDENSPVEDTLDPVNDVMHEKQENETDACSGSTYLSTETNGINESSSPKTQRGWLEGNTPLEQEPPSALAENAIVQSSQSNEIEVHELEAHPIPPITESSEVSELLEYSKALLHNVSKTLEEGNSPSGRVEHSQSSASKQKIIAQNAEKIVILPVESPAADVNSKEISPAYIKEGLDEGKKQSISDLDMADNLDESLVPKRLVPERCIKIWAAEIILALEALHEIGITYGNLHINDILFGESGHVLVCHKSLWNQVDDPLTWNSYMAPEVRDSIGIPLWKVHSSADWWSVGAILFLLLTGQTFDSIHHEGVFPDMVVKVPECNIKGSGLSRCAQTLLSELLQHSPTIRLGYYGAAEIKSHPFFEGFDWTSAANEFFNDA